MFMKCEQATNNPDVLLTGPYTNKISNRNEFGQSSNHDSYNQKSSLNVQAQRLPQSSNFNPKQMGFDQELKQFLKENERILTNDNLTNMLLSNQQNENIQQINSALDEMV